MRILAGLAALASLTGCSMLASIVPKGSIETKDAPDTSRTLPQMPLRVGLYSDDATLLRREEVAGVTFQSGSMAATEAEARFRLVFPLVVPLNQMPPAVAERDQIDVVVRVEPPSVTSVQSQNGDIKLELLVPFSICSLSGTRVDLVIERASVLLVNRTAILFTRFAAMRIAMRGLVEAVIHQFLVRVPELMNKRYDK